MKVFDELNETTKKDIIIDGVMRSKGVYLLVSKPKVGKPLFALHLVNSIANKKAFLGHEILKPSPVLYITTELSDSQLKDRCIWLIYDNILSISIWLCLKYAVLYATWGDTMRKVELRMNKKNMKLSKN